MTSPDQRGADAGGKRNIGSVSRLVHGTDLKLAIAIWVICGVLYYITTTFDEVPPLLAQNIGPEWFPRLLIWTIVILTIVLPFEHRFLAGGRARLDSDRTERIPTMAIITAGLLVLTVLSVVLFGTFLAMIFVCAALPLLWGERRWKVLVPYVILFPAAVALLFTQVLRVYFQPGLYGFAL